MQMDADLVQAMAREMLGRQNLEPGLLAETTRRITALLDRVRALDSLGLGDLGPALGFDPTHPAYRQAPAPGEPAWAPMAAAGPGGSGYGGTGGSTGGALDQAAAPRPATAPAPGGGDALNWLGAADVAAAIRRRELSATAAVQAALARLEATEPALNAFVTVMAADALSRARAVDAALARGEAPGPLAGVPVAVKDLFAVAGFRTTAGSRVLADHVSTGDATCVSRLRAAGAILIGKTATHEFAFGPTTDSPYHGPTRNPWDTGRVPGGSSGGSGAAVAAGVVPGALGTDTGGSIRCPAALCGVVGLKPSFGRVSKHGVVPLSWSLDHPGPLTRTVEDAALFLSVLAGPDPEDPAALPVPPGDYAAGVAMGQADGLRGVRVGVPLAWLSSRVDPEVRSALDGALAALRDLGATVDEAVLPPADVMMLVNRLITMGEAGAYHAPLLARWGPLYSPDVRARLELAQFIMAQDYVNAQRLRTDLSRRMAAVMTQFDVLALPAAPIPAARIGQGLWDYGDATEPVAEALIRLTAPFSVSGQPAMSMPCGFTAAGLPVGLQIVGRPLDEATVLRVGAAFAARSGHGRRRPPL